MQPLRQPVRTDRSDIVVIPLHAIPGAPLLPRANDCTVDDGKNDITVTIVERKFVNSDVAIWNLGTVNLYRIKRLLRYNPTRQALIINLSRFSFNKNRWALISRLIQTGLRHKLVQEK